MPCPNCRLQSTTRGTWCAERLHRTSRPELLGAWLMSADNGMAATNGTRPPGAKQPSPGCGARVGRRPAGPGDGGQEEPAQGLPRPLVLHARRDRAVELRGPAPDRRFLTFGSGPAWPRSSTRAPTTSCAASPFGGLRLDPGHLVRRPRWPADAADAPLGGDALRRRDDDPHAARLLHRRVPQAARAQLGDRLPCCSCSARSRASPATRCPTTCCPAPASAPRTAS